MPSLLTSLQPPGNAHPLPVGYGNFMLYLITPEEYSFLNCRHNCLLCFILVVDDKLPAIGFYPVIIQIADH